MTLVFFAGALGALALNMAAEIRWPHRRWVARTVLWSAVSVLAVLDHATPAARWFALLAVGSLVMAAARGPRHRAQHSAAYPPARPLRRIP